MPADTADMSPQASARISPNASADESDRLVERWRELESAHARVREALERALERKHRLSLSEYEVLRRLAESSEGHRRIQELAEEVHLSQSALSRLVQRLQDDGLVTRKACDYDRRGIFACVTDAGREAQEEAHPTHRAVIAETLGKPTSPPWAQ
jgi:DNA-binding MarR family transcriptional regulator